jgi:hypothetical protein
VLDEAVEVSAECAAEVVHNRRSVYRSLQLPPLHVRYFWQQR